MINLTVKAARNKHITAIVTKNDYTLRLLYDVHKFLLLTR